MLYELMEDRAANMALATTAELYGSSSVKKTDCGNSVSSVESDGSNKSVKVVTPRASRKTQLPRSSIRSKKKKQRVLDDMESETIELIEAARGTEREKLEETKRHNLVMEQSVGIQMKSMEMQYKMELFKNYNIMKNEGWTNDNISRVFPEMEMFCLHN